MASDLCGTRANLPRGPGPRIEASRASGVDAGGSRSLAVWQGPGCLLLEPRARPIQGIGFTLLTGYVKPGTLSDMGEEPEPWRDHAEARRSGSKRRSTAMAVASWWGT